MLGCGSFPPRSYFGRTRFSPAASMAVTTWRSVVHAPWGAIVATKVSPPSSTWGEVVAEISVSRRYASRS